MQDSFMIKTTMFCATQFASVQCKASAARNHMNSRGDGDKARRHLNKHCLQQTQCTGFSCNELSGHAQASSTIYNVRWSCWSGICWGDIKCAMQEVKSNSKVSSTGKSKRWSALAFWKKSTGKTRQPAEAKAAAAAAAAVSKADEELAPLRRRSSSYHSLFIALAKQVSNHQLYMMFYMTHGCTRCKQCSALPECCWKS